MQFFATNVYQVDAQTGEVFHYIRLTYDDREADALMRELQLQRQQQQRQQQQNNINTGDRENTEKAPAQHNSEQWKL